MEKKEQEVAEEYLSSLADLNLNSKPLINMLTILAEENIEFAPVIVKAVEQHITKVNAEVKLPVLYLIDSIVKNVGREYIQLFSHSIVNIFCGVFEKVNEKIREKMYTLRQTWNDVFTPQKLYTLDVKVNCMDPNWPITAKVVPKSPAIHVNPNFLKNKGEPLNEMEAKLRDKQRQLLELQKRKLELELAATKQRLEEQEKQLQSTIQSDTAKPAITANVAAATPLPAVPNKPIFVGPTNKAAHLQKPIPPGSAAMPFPPANNNAPKIRVAPVNSALLNSIRQRDPRLARQQQQQQAALAAAQQQTIMNSAAGSDTPSSQLPGAGTLEVQNSVKKDISADKSVQKSSSKSIYGNINREKSKSTPSSAYGNNSGSNITRRAHRGTAEKSGSVDGKKSPVSSAASVPLSPTALPSSRNSNSKTHSSSSSRSSGMSKSRESSKSSSTRDKLSSYERDRKRKIDSSPHKGSEKGSTSKQTEKSPKRSADGSSKTSSHSSSNSSGVTTAASPTKFQDIAKQRIKSRNYMRRNREKSSSPTPPSPPPPPTSSHDTDLRDTLSTSSTSPEKRMKISSRAESAITEVVTDTIRDVGSSAVVSVPVSSPSIVATTFKANESDGSAPIASAFGVSSVSSSNSKAENLEENIDMAPASLTKDIDLRQLHPSAVTTAKSSSAMGASTINVGPDAANGPGPVNSEPVDEADPKKRAVATLEDIEEPATKKTRSEKIDSLFGTEDVDLRTLSAPSNHLGMGMSSVMPSTPPPPPIISNESESWTKVKGVKSNKSSASKSNLDDVRAKLAKAAKGEKYEKDLKSFKKASRFNDVHEDSQDGTDTNIRTIISQAQEMLESDNMDVEQYNTLMKTVIHINEKSKLKEAQRRESLLTKKEVTQDLTPISDDEVRFSSEEDDVETKIAKSKVLSKRIPKVSRKDENSTVESKFEQSSVLRRSPTPTSGTSSYADNNRQQSLPNQTGSKSEKRTRTKESKWSPWEPNAATQASTGKPKWVVGNTNFRPQFPAKGANMANVPNMMNRGTVPNPWQNPPQLIFAGPPAQSQIPPPPPVPPIVNPILPTDTSTVTPGPPLPPPILLPPLSNSVDNPNADVVRTINIDGVPKEIRFYDEVAIAFMEWDQPKEIGFQAGQRRIMIDDHDMITLSFNDVYKTVMVDGNPHQMRFGCPTRELYIDNNWYECYFGDPPIRIFLDGRLRVFKIEGPAPQVRIGNTRQDLVVGKINLIIDALLIVPVFLDAKVQTFQINDTVHTLQFADQLRTVLIDNIPFDVEYGGLPKSMHLNGVKHFVRFGTLPNGIVPGTVIIQNMVRTDRFAAIDLPMASPESAALLSVNPGLPTQLPMDAALPVLNPAMNDALAQGSVAPNNGEIINETHSDSSVQSIAASVGNLNIDELFQKLLASGILNQNQGVSKADESKKEKLKEKPIIPIDLSRPETIKTRQAPIIQKLFSGMQCSSCGVRFPPEQTMKYSQHLDWHFRQNRKERDNSRRAHSRKWYYDVSDWIQYEEIEDLEEREKNWFETQQNETENVDENSNQRTSSPPPSCPAGPDDVDRCCDMCHDKFEQFYNEESEEWHLRDAIRVEDKIYHPICYEDFKASLTMDSILQTTNDVDDNAMDSVVVKSEKDDDVIMEEKAPEVIEDDDDEDDVIVLPTEEPSIQEIPDDDEDVIIEQPSLESELLVPDSESDVNTKKDEEAAKDSEALESDDVEIQEPHIPFTDLDTYEETAERSVSTVDDSSQSSQFNVIKIKEEPKDDGYNEDDAFEEVGTIICDDDISTQADEDTPKRPDPAPVVIAPLVPKPPVASASNSNILVLHDPSSSIDGNVDVQETPATTTGANKIKINISKSAIRSESNTVAQSSSSNKTSAAVETSSGADNSTNSAKRLEDDDSIQYALKPALANVALKKVPRTVSGLETSGLCSIM